MKLPLPPTLQPSALFLCSLSHCSHLSLSHSCLLLLYPTGGGGSWSGVGDISPPLLFFLSSLSPPLTSSPFSSHLFTSDGADGSCGGGQGPRGKRLRKGGNSSSHLISYTAKTFQGDHAPHCTPHHPSSLQPPPLTSHPPLSPSLPPSPS